ncbi:MAG: biotin/lipoyl-binding protein, partial [Bacteroidales bacterium]|nr:biotin/lipoyl-binding protein [Bacteroidales bacterium]
MRRITSIFLLFATMILSSCQDGEKNSSSTGETLYETLEVSLSNRTLTTGYSATISGVQTVEVRPQVSGMIVDILIEEGESVSKDQVLFIIDQTPYKAAYQIAVANVKSAEAALSTAQLVLE